MSENRRSVTDMTVPRSAWTEFPPGRWYADAEGLGVEYCLVAGEDVFRRGTAWWLVWDCPACERRVRLAAQWNHCVPCGEACFCEGWSGICACGDQVTIYTVPALKPTPGGLA